MKVYKKLATIAPIAALSTSILFTPVMTFAEENPATMQTKTLATQTNPIVGLSSGSNLQVVSVSDIKSAIDQILTIRYGSDSNPQFQAKLKAIVNNWTPTFENATTDFSLGTVKVDRYDDDNLELVSYENNTGTGKDQTFVTPATKKAKTESFTYSNSEGVKLGVSSATKLSAQIPFVAEGGETITTSFEANYNHTSSNTTTNTTEVTYPSQTIVCPDGYKLSLMVKTSNAIFSGSFVTDKKIANEQELIDQLNQLVGSGSPQQIPKDLTLYKIFSDKSNLSSGQLSSWMDAFNKVKPELNSSTQTVNFGTISIPFTGVAGHLSDAKLTSVKLTNLDTGKLVTMPLDEYKNPTIRTKLLQQSK